MGGHRSAQIVQTHGQKLNIDRMRRCGENLIHLTRENLAADDLETHISPHAVATIFLTRVTAPLALPLYPSAPISLAYRDVTGAPPTSTFTRVLRPAAFRASVVVFMACVVTVSRGDMQTNCGSYSSTAVTNLSGATSLPRSTTSNPLPSSMEATMFLPMSCRSPLSVPIITLVDIFSPVLANRGRSSSIALFMARPASSSSGTKYSSASNSRIGRAS